jgi:hypothetical protein
MPSTTTRAVFSAILELEETVVAEGEDTISIVWNKAANDDAESLV